MRISVSFTLLIIMVSIFSCTQEEKSSDILVKDGMSLKTVKSDKIVPGPLRHDNLSDDQLNRIKILQKIFAETSPIPFEEWVDGFRRDVHPEQEIRVWEMMAHSYSAYIEGKDLSMDQKNEIYVVILQRSMMPAENVLQRLELKHITEKEAREAMDLYKSDPKPPTVERIK